MNEKQEAAAHGHLQVIGERGNRRWRAFWWDPDGKHTRVLGPAWVQDSGKKTSRGAIVWHAANGPKPDPSHLTPKEAQSELRFSCPAVFGLLNDWLWEHISKGRSLCSASKPWCVPVKWGQLSGPKRKPVAG